MECRGENGRGQKKSETCKDVREKVALVEDAGKVSER